MIPKKNISALTVPFLAFVTTNNYMRQYFNKHLYYQTAAAGKTEYTTVSDVNTQQIPSNCKYKLVSILMTSS